MVADLEVAKPHVEKCYKLAWYLVKLDLTFAGENNYTRASVQGKRGRIRSRPEEGSNFSRCIFGGDLPEASTPKRIVHRKMLHDPL